MPFASDILALIWYIHWAHFLFVCFVFLSLPSFIFDDLSWQALIVHFIGIEHTEHGCISRRYTSWILFSVPWSTYCFWKEGTVNMYFKLYPVLSMTYSVSGRRLWNSAELQCLSSVLKIWSSHINILSQNKKYCTPENISNNTEGNVITSRKQFILPQMFGLSILLLECFMYFFFLPRDWNILFVSLIYISAVIMSLPKIYGEYCSSSQEGWWGPTECQSQAESVQLHKHHQPTDS